MVMENDNWDKKVRDKISTRMENTESMVKSDRTTHKLSTDDGPTQV